MLLNTTIVLALLLFVVLILWTNERVELSYGGPEDLLNKRCKNQFDLQLVSRLDRSSGCCYRTIFCLSARRRFDPSLAVFARLVMYDFQVSHYATSNNLVSQSLHAFSLRHLVTRDFLAPFL